MNLSRRSPIQSLKTGGHELESVYPASSINETPMMNLDRDANLQKLETVSQLALQSDKRLSQDMLVVAKTEL
jgi:hypothetical protein